VKGELTAMKQQIQLKESGVKSDIERMWSEWQEKLEYTENELHTSETRLLSLEGDKKAVSKQILDFKKDARAQGLEVSELKQQLHMLHE
jgi:hypothetical protein